ncbi:MAG: hypothetical protein QM761_02970 [Pseudoxanthomonas sp.]
MRTPLPLAVPLAAWLALAALPAAGQQAKSPLRWQNFSQTPQAQPQSPSLPQPEPPRAPVEVTSDYLQRMDADHDGRVSLAEYLDWMSYSFDARDLDHDGVLSADELPGGKGAPITREQHRQRLAERFRKQDANRDGFLDAKELSAPPQ